MNQATRMRASVEARLLDAVGAVVRAAVASDGRVIVACSGGLDSTVLLHAAARAGQPDAVEVLHIDHGWHPDSGDWAMRCAHEAKRLGLRCRVERIDAAPLAGRSPEEVAREARYAAFARWLAPGDTLLTAHHGDDQLETMLIRLLRGAGVRGLRAIHAVGPCGQGRLVRPLLDFSRAELEQVARAWQLDWIVDPANANPRFDRGYLRAEVLPAIRARWPGAHRAAHRAARHMRDADRLLDELARIDAGGLVEPDRVPLERLTGLDAARQSNLLRHLIRRCALGMPDERRLAELRRCLNAPGGPRRNAHVGWRGGEARIFGGHLYLLAPLVDAVRSGGAGLVGIGRPWQGPEGRVELIRQSDTGIPENWARAGLRVEFRRGGERFKPAGSAHHRRLKQWFQEARVVPWMRGRVPLLYHEDRLVAVADLVLGEVPAQVGGARWGVVWTGHGRVQ